MATTNAIFFHTEINPRATQKPGLLKRTSLSTILSHCLRAFSVAHCASLCLSVILLPLPTFALDTLSVTSPDPILESWRWTAFDESNGLSGTIQDVFEDRDGHLWFATSEGAKRYDGYRWTVYKPFGNQRMQSVMQARDGALWFGTFTGIRRLDPSAHPEQAWTTYTTDNGLATNIMAWRCLLEARDGTIWAGCWNPSLTSLVGDAGLQGGISRFDGKTWTTIDVPVGPPRPSILHMIETADGSIWFSTVNQELLRYKDEEWMRYTVEDGLAGNRPGGLLEAQDGTLWCGFYEGGISRFDGQTWQTYTSRDGLPQDIKFNKLWQTKDGTLWAGSDDAKMNARFCRFDGTRWQVYAPEALSTFSGNILGTPVQDGSVWVFAFSRPQAFRFDSGRIATHYTHVDSLHGGYEGADGSMWFFTRRQAVRLKNGVWLGYGAEDGFLDGEVDRLYQAPSGALWFIGKHKGGTAACRYDGAEWRIFTERDGLNHEVLLYRRSIISRIAVLETRSGVVYFGGQHEGKAALCRYDSRTETWTRYTEKDGIVGEWIDKIYEASDGTLWIGSRSARDLGYGLFRFDGKTWIRYTEEQGLSNSRITDIAEWPNGTLWVGTLAGISRLNLSASVDKPVWWNKTDFHVGNPKVMNFLPTKDALYFGFIPVRKGGVGRYDGETFQSITAQDGLVSNEVNMIVQASDGAIWVASPDGLGRFDGTTWARYTETDGLMMRGSERFQYPKVREMSDGTFWVDGLEGYVIHFDPASFDSPETSLEPAADLVSSAGNILLKWSGTDKWNRTPPEELRYQWRLNSGDWVSVGNNPDHTFTELADGAYRFEVRAVNRYGKSDSVPAVHAFVVEAPWWKNPFVIGIALCLVGLTGLQTSRVVRRDRRLHELNTDLSVANTDLTVESALERVRGRALGMHSSKEISDVGTVLFKEFGDLGFEPFRTTIMIIDEEKNRSELWSIREGYEAPVIPILMPEVSERGPLWEAWKQQEQNPYWIGEPQTRDEQIEGRNRILENADLPPEKVEEIRRMDPEPDALPESLISHRIFFSHGVLTLNMTERMSEADLAIAKRFADAFDFAYARFLELVEAEEQTRAAERRAAVDRVRAEAMGMRQASDIEQVVVEILKELSDAGITFNACGIHIVDKAEGVRRDYGAASSGLTGQGEQPLSEVSEEWMSIWKSGKPEVRHREIHSDMTGKGFMPSDPLTTLDAPFSHGTFSINRVGHQDFTEEEMGLVSAFADVISTSSTRDTFSDDEATTLREFANAIALGYARYLDIREIQEQTQKKSAFLASMSHELRTPMNAIKGFTNLVLRREKGLSDRNRENLEKVTQASDHLLAMINDILDLSKIEAGRMDVNVSTFDVGQLVDYCVSTVSPLVKEGVILRAEVEESIGEAHTDQARLRGMLINLTSNAIKFTDSGRVIVKASIQETGDRRQETGDRRQETGDRRQETGDRRQEAGESKDGQMLEISVSDTGKGIPEEELPTIFDEYRQVEGSDREHKGTGLGLSITRRFAELLGGSVGVESEVGKGS